MVDNSYQALLGSYGWKINADKVYGPNVWADGTSTYNNRLEPFYLTGAGMILAGTLSEGMRHAGSAGFTWSSAPTSMTMNGSMTIAGAAPSGLASDTQFLGGTNFGRNNMFSLRCLTQ